MFAALDVITNDRPELAQMLGRWAAMAARFTAGKPVRTAEIRPEQAPQDTGEAMDLGPYSLTITVGFGPAMFDDRFGLAGELPGRAAAAGHHSRRRGAARGDLRRRPVHPGLRRRPAGRLPRRPQPGQGGPRDGRAALVPARLRPGVGNRRRARRTPRNLLGFKDGTNNIHADDGAAIDEHVWVDASIRPGRGCGRHLPGRPQDPDGDPALGRRPARRPGADLRSQQDHRRTADRWRRSSLPSTSPRRPPPASR